MCAATIYVEAHKLKALCKSVCAAEAQGGGAPPRAGGEGVRAEENFRGATATVLAPADSDELREGVRVAAAGDAPLRNDVAARLGTRATRPSHRGTVRITILM